VGPQQRWTGLGLDWIRTIANFVEFGLDPECKALQNLGSDRIWTELMEKKWGIFVVKRLHFSNVPDFIWT